MDEVSSPGAGAGVPGGVRPPRVRYARLVRIALDHNDEVGFRAGRILLGDRRVETLGLIGKSPSDSGDPRLERASDLDRYDLVVTDAAEPEGIIDRALAAGAACVVWREVDLDTGPGLVLSGSNLAAGIAPCLASHEVARASSIGEITIAWTEPGTPLRRGEPLAFPDPVGGRWGRPRGKNAFAAPVAGEWAAAMAKVRSASDSDAWTRIVGVSDLAGHLEGIALAAGALAVGAGAYLAGGLRRPPDAAEAYLTEALGAGLDVAAYTLTG